jgi:hypothetical protein
MDQTHASLDRLLSRRFTPALELNGIGSAIDVVRPPRKAKKPADNYMVASETDGGT